MLHRLLLVNERNNNVSTKRKGVRILSIGGFENYAWRIEQSKAAARRRRDLHAGIGSYFDWFVLSLPDTPAHGSDIRTLERVECVLQCESKRFVDALRRIEETQYSDVPEYVLACSQGAARVCNWRGYSMFKSVFDMGVYMHLLQSVRPCTIFEIGSGSGGSALWFESMTEALGLGCRIVSIDVAPPDVVDETSVVFLEADAFDLGASLTYERLSAMAHPWLVVEDAHVAVAQILDFFDEYLLYGDYIVVEDSADKQAVLREFLGRSSREYLCDTGMTDFFGVNATSAANSIWKAGS